MTDNYHQAMFLGKYKFYQGGVLVGESTNLITAEGKRHIMRYLAGQTRILAGGIAVGIGSAAATASDDRLTYEIGRATIYLSSPDYTNNKIIFKGTLEQGLVGSIYEVGLYSTDLGASRDGRTSFSLLSFEDGLETWQGGSFVASGHRSGFTGLRLSPAASGTLSSVLLERDINLSPFTLNDKLSLAFLNEDTNTSSLELRLRGLDPDSYYSYTVTDPVAGYNVVTFNKADLVKTGIVDFGSIDSVEVRVSSKATGPAGVIFDGLRVESTLFDTENILISRSVLTDPVLKTNIEEMDIEYSLEVVNL